MLISGRPRSAACDAAATKPAHLLRLTPTPRPYPVFRENRRPSTCGFILARDAMVGGCRPNVVDGPVSWRGSRGRPEWSPIGGRRQRRPPAGRAPRAYSGIEGPRRPGPAPASAPRALVQGVAPRGTPAPAPPESFSKIVLASPSEFPYSTSSHGGVAQLGERLTGSQEVRGSIPLVSTRALNEAPTQVGAFFHIGTQGQRRHHDPPGRQDRKKLRRTRPL